MSEFLPKNAKFSLGQIVYHSKFKYRGVIVDADPNFQGTDEWYESVAKSKPDKNKTFGTMYLFTVREMRLMWLNLI